MSVSSSDMSAKKQHFDVGAMMKARKESKLLHEKIVVETQAVAEKKDYLVNLKKKGKRLDCKVSLLLIFKIYSHSFRIRNNILKHFTICHVRTGMQFYYAIFIVIKLIICYHMNDI